MAKQLVNIETVANDGTGDTLRVAFNKINNNTNELYTLVGAGQVLTEVSELNNDAQYQTLDQVNTAINNLIAYIFNSIVL